MLRRPHLPTDDFVGTGLACGITVMTFFLVRKRVVLCVYELMLFRLDGYADMFIPCVETYLDRLNIHFIRIQKFYSKGMIAENLCLPGL